MNHRIGSASCERLVAKVGGERPGRRGWKWLALVAGTLALVVACGSDDEPTADAATIDAPDGVDAANPDADVPPDAAPDADLVDAYAPCQSDMVYVPTASVCIDRFEASHDIGNIARSNPGVQPWVNVTWENAKSGCEAAGKRLCTEAEWEAACVGPAPGSIYPYGDVFGAHTCNGADHGVGAAVNTGSMTNCEGGFPHIFDMSGNVWEWTSTCSGSCRARGGSFSLGGDYLTMRCSGATSFETNGDTAYLGFRCCMDPPGT